MGLDDANAEAVVEDVLHTIQAELRDISLEKTSLEIRILAENSLRAKARRSLEGFLLILLALSFLGIVFF
jgi:hypothetical protein